MATLSLSGLTLTPVFDPAVSTYYVEVPQNVTQTTLSAEALSSGDVEVIKGFQITEGSGATIDIHNDSVTFDNEHECTVKVTVDVNNYDASVSGHYKVYLHKDPGN